VTVEETIIEVSTKHSPTGERYVAKPYPKDNDPRTFGVDDDWLEAIAHHIEIHGIGRDQLLFTSSTGRPISRNTFRTRVWQPAVKASGVDFAVRMHDLRHATPPGSCSSPKDPTSGVSWNAWDTHRSKPPRSTCTHSPKPTRRTSTPSPVRAAGGNNPTEGPPLHLEPQGRRPMHDPADEALIQEILPVLEVDHQYTRLVEAWNHQLVAQIRRCGREAGKRLRYKIRTLTSDPQQRDDRRIAVWVVVTSSNPDDEDSIRERSELLISKTLNQLLG
jgi:hypothetical protein